MIKESVRIGNLIKKGNELIMYFDHIDDVGCSNLDSCLIKFDKPKKVFIEIISEVSGIPILKLRNNTYLISIDYRSQGFRRMKKAETFCDYLNSHGISSFVEYNTD